MLYAYSEATVPKITLVTRKRLWWIISGYVFSRFRADLVIAWPTAEIAVMGAEGAATLFSAKKLKQLIIL